MSLIRVTYHHEAGVWWAESDDLPGFSALADTFAETAALVREAAGTDGVEYREELEGGGLLVARSGAPISIGTPMMNWSQRAGSPEKAALTAESELLQTA